MNRFFDNSDLTSNVHEDLSPTSVPTGPSTGILPLTPEDLEALDCLELDPADTYRRPLVANDVSHTVPYITRWQDNLFSSVASGQAEDMLVMPWMNGESITRFNTLVCPPPSDVGHKAGSRVAALLNRRKRPASPDAPASLSPPSKYLKQDSSETEQIEHEQEQENIVFGEPHVLVDGPSKYCCSCGQGFTAKSSFDRHILQQSGAQPFACSLCGKKFARKDTCLRHENNQCKTGKVACPCCRKGFRKDYLRAHLESRANVECQLFVEAMQLKTCGMQAGTKVADVVNHFWSDTAKGWGYSARDYPIASSLINAGPSSMEKTGWEPSLRERKVPRRPIQRRAEEPCDLCGEKLGFTDLSLMAHHKRHMQDFAAKTHECKECQLLFAHKQDLDRHLQAAKRRHCGLNFNHELNAQGVPICTGHHPPRDPRHGVMQLCLWNWEQCQLLAHRATIVRILADRLTLTQASHTSLMERDLACMALVRWSIDSLQSFNSAPSNLEYKDAIDIQALAADFEDLMADPQAKPSQTHPPERPRPDSLALSHFTAGIDTSRWNENDLWMQPPAIVNMQPNYVDRVRALRSPPAIEPKSSGVRRYAAQVNRYLFNPGHALETRFMRSAVT